MTNFLLELGNCQEVHAL